MKDLLSVFAAYNQAANAALATILAGQDEAVLREDQGSFYKSVIGTFEHVVGAEVSWLKRYPTFFPGTVLEGKALVVADIEATKARMSSSVKELLAVAKEADALLVSFIGGVTEQQLGARVKYKTYKGDELERTFGHLLMHILNHGTHHRGEISALLDRKGIKNDYSGFSNYQS